jgi:hypothetical protein
MGSAHQSQADDSDVGFAADFAHGFVDFSNS